MLLDGSAGNGAEPPSQMHSSLLREATVKVNEVLLCAGAVALLALRLRATRRKRQLDRAYAEALSQVARRGKWAVRKAFVVAVLIAAARIWLGAHA